MFWSWYCNFFYCIVFFDAIFGATVLCGDKCNLGYLQLKFSYLCCRQKHEKGFTVCGLAWHPSGSQIAYTDTEGRLGLLDGLGTSTSTTTTEVLLRKQD